MIRTREPLEVDRATLPTDGTFQRIGVERRQVFDIQISSVVTEYQAEILEDEHGRRVVAPFPKHVTVKAQYASGVKIHSVYMSNFQLLPYKRIEEHFADQFAIALSTGSLDNFNKEAYEKLAPLRGLGQAAARQGAPPARRRDWDQHRRTPQVAACGLQPHADTADAP
jgi:transposase